jgi:hypothetical protein
MNLPNEALIKVPRKLVRHVLYERFFDELVHIEFAHGSVDQFVNQSFKALERS